MSVQLSQQYGQEIGLGGDVTMYTGSLILTSSQQVYNFNSEADIPAAHTGSRLEITDMSVVGGGTSACVLNMSGYVENMGVQDVVANLTLQNFVTTYAAPVAVATTATCSLDNSVTIKPLENVVRHTENVYIKDVAGASAGTATVSADEQEIVYTAPSSGSSETITYKVNDGISTSSSAANIVITFTP